MGTWGLFLFDSIVAFAALYVPGFIFLRGFNLHRISSFAIAPIVSIFEIFLFSYLYSKTSVACNGALLLVSCLVLSFLFWLLSFVFRRQKRTVFAGECESEKNLLSWKYAAIYILVGILASLYVFVKTLDGPASFAQQYDNYAHLTYIRTFLDTGVYSLTGILDYPIAWHQLAALVASLGMSELTVAVNAVNFIISAIVFPVGVFFFISQVIDSRKIPLICGALCAVAFTEFPWGLIVFGPLYPNLLAYALLPAVLTIFTLFIAAKKRSQKIMYLVLFILGCASLVFAHPNSIFAGIVIMVPFVASRIIGRKTSTVLKRVLLLLAFVAFVFCIWCLLYKAPQFSGVTSFNWPAYLSVSEALSKSLVLALSKYSVPQVALAILVIFGCLYCLVKRKNRWLIVSYLITLFILIIAGATEGSLKHFLAGFWYTDTFRIAAVAAIVGIPLATLGLYGVMQVVFLVLEKFKIKLREQKIGFIFCLLVCSSLVFMPSFNYFDKSIDTAFGKTRELLTDFNNLSDSSVYSESEVEFVEKAKNVVDADAVVANVPFDGSFLSYGVNGFRVSYNQLETRAYWDGVSDPNGELIRACLCDYVSDEKVKDVAAQQKIQYVILLDNDDINGERMVDCNKDLALWQGIMSITDETPGFEVVLAEDDMRLYRLTDV